MDAWPPIPVRLDVDLKDRVPEVVDALKGKNSFVAAAVEIFALPTDLLLPIRWFPSGCGLCQRKGRELRFASCPSLTRKQGDAQA